MSEIHVSHLHNYTGHKLVLICASGEKYPLQSHGLARLNSEMVTENKIWWRGAHYSASGVRLAVPILEITEREIIGLPEPDTESFFVVSGLVASAARRDDVLCPGRMIKNNKGEVIGCGALIRVRAS